MRALQPWRVVTAVGEGPMWVAQLWYPQHEVWADLGDPKPSELAAGQRIYDHLTTPSSHHPWDCRVRVDDRSQETAPSAMWRAGLLQLEIEAFQCQEAGRDHGEEVAPELLSAYACRIEATWIRRPMPGWPSPTMLCDVHAEAWARWWASFQRDRRITNTMRGAQVAAACRSSRRRQEDEDDL